LLFFLLTLILKRFSSGPVWDRSVADTPLQRRSPRIAAIVTVEAVHSTAGEPHFNIGASARSVRKRTPHRGSKPMLPQRGIHRMADEPEVL
jgi:hypothetical protein